MAVVCQLVQDIKYTGFCPQFRIFGKTQLLGNTVGCDKTDAKNIGCQAVRVFFDHLDGPASVLLEYLCGIA